jgi:Ca2+-binding RTX toxin-like protein
MSHGRRDRTRLRSIARSVNDELLGHHGSDTLSGSGGHDILWGDWDRASRAGRAADLPWLG